MDVTLLNYLKSTHRISLRPIIIICCLTFISGCGGGNSESPNSGAFSEVPAPDSQSGEDEWDPQVPNYYGRAETYSLSLDNYSETVLSVAESMDFLHMLAFGDQVSSAYIFEENRLSVISDQSVTCEAGSYEEIEVEAQTRIELKYNDCVIDGLSVNGSVRVKLESENELIFIFDLSMTTDFFESSASIKGFFSLNTADVAKFNLLLEDDLGNQVWFEDFTLSLFTNTDEYGIDYQGNIYDSDLGKLILSTNENGSRAEPYTQIQINGSSELVFDVYFNDKITYPLADDYLPINISLESKQSFDLPDNNQPPIAFIGLEKSILERNEQQEVSARSSLDPNFDPLKFSWTLLSAPELAELDTFETDVFTFNSDIPGDYSFQLSVTDTKGLTATTSTIITVKKHIPQADLVANSNQVLIDSTYQAKIQLENDELDGPFEFLLGYGPANMEVDQEGNIVWHAKLPNFGMGVNVNFSVVALNDSGEKVIESTIEVTPTKQVSVTKLSDNASLMAGELVSVEESGKRRLFSFSQSVDEISVTENEVSATSIIALSPSQNAQYRAMDDVNGDDINDYWLQFEDVSDELQPKIAWVDGSTQIFNVFKNLQGSEFFVTDYNYDGNKDIIELGNSNGYTIFDVETGELIGSADYTRTATGFCDFNNDGYTEAYDEYRIYDLHNETQLFSNSTQISVVDADSDGICEVIHGNISTLFITSFVEGQIDKEIFSAISTYSYFAGNFDDDSGKDIFVSVYRAPPNENELYLINLSSDRIQKLPADESNLLTKILVGNSDIIDFDGDGIDEFVFVSGDTSEISIESIHLSDDTFVSSTLSAGVSSAHTLSVWDNDDMLGHFHNLSQQLFISDSVSQTAYSVDKEILQVSNFDNGIQYLARDNETASYFSFMDLSGNEIWTKDFSNEATNTFVKLNSTHFLLVNDQEEAIYNLNSGEKQFSQSLSNKSMIYYFSDRGSFPFYVLSLASNSIFQINADNSVQNFSDEALETFIQDSNGDAKILEFVNLDNNDNVKLVEMACCETPIELNFFDILSQQLDEPSNSYINVASNDNPLKNQPFTKLLSCLPWDTQCRNVVGTNDRGLIVSRDKITGSVIWASPQFSDEIESLIIKQEQNQSKLAVSLKNGDVLMVE